MRVLAERQQVVVVPTHLGSRQAQRGDADARQLHQALAGQQAHLDLARDAQLLLESLPLALLLDQGLERARHQVERLGQVAQLVVRADPDHVREVALAQALRADREVVHAARDLARQQQTERQREAVQADERRPQDPEQVQQELGHRVHAQLPQRRGREAPHDVHRLVAEGDRQPLDGALLARRPVRLLRKREPGEPAVGLRPDARAASSISITEPFSMRSDVPSGSARPALDHLALDHVDPGAPLDAGVEHLVGRDLDHERRVALHPGGPQHLR